MQLSKKILLVIACIIMVTTVSSAQIQPNWNNARTFVREMYLRILGRSATKAELATTTLLLIKCEIEREDIIKTFFSSYEYVLRERTNRQFVFDAYYAILRRHTSLEEASSAINALNTGHLSREQLVVVFLTSPEYLNLTQGENDCLFSSPVAFYHVFPNGGYTIQNVCDHVILDVPELKKFELIVLVTNLCVTQEYPYKGQIFFMADLPLMGGSWGNSVKARKYGYYHLWPEYHKRLKFEYHLADGFAWGPLLSQIDWNPSIVYDFRMIVSDDNISFWMNGELMTAGPKTCEWDPEEQIFWAGCSTCHDSDGGFGSIPGTTYISVKMIDLE